ncbi:Ubiquitin-associated/translation elongation factor EF1B protein [Raphanus sativus]|uniref:Uncharacterized protein LOC108816945 n=1 Tax=Raphanus sativus TaxID=3726 RepID=A0A6J0KDC2_RAPSA|nr:uncharacterized protein LOC108816945 [Raphanus sativus]XP_056847203.1 uncharacterized protein LOC108816945 [Raphanus sativus]XP_056847204.1 uncharacterized protein LOC108816945 [Raphanus sativus]KAJ4882977.1 Ubiquitin-associated/translation elongation factor EF1B protein [Raphanus sativus]
MSTAAKTKSRDKKVVNESQKTPSKATIGAITTGGAYNPLLGTFQPPTVDSTGSSSSLHSNGRFRNIDESDSNCDSASNNGSWSGDSEDHKEKAAPTTAKQETIPGADNNDKREKMRLKNERKHQRQKEKRAQELHERCCQFLMSRKLEVLAQKLIGMGIPHERATYALMLNEGKLEESINWHFDDGGANVADKKLDPTSGNLKLDISQELSRILELETKYKCSKQDVEKAVVTAEGDIEKAEESLRRQKQEQSAASIKVEDVSNSASASKVSSVHTSQSSVAAQLQPNSGMYHHAGGEVERKNIGYPRGSSYISGESGNQSVNPMDKINMRMELMKMQQNAAIEEKKRMSYQPQPLQRPTEGPHYVAALGDHHFKRVQQQEMREPVTVMQQQRSQSAKTNVLPVSTMNTSFTVAATAAAAAGGSGWYPANRSEVAQSNGYLPTRTLPPTDLNPNLMYQQQLQYQQYQGQMNNGHRMAGASSPHTVAPAASLGLFSGYGSTPSSGLEWSTDGSAAKSDYNNIDWSLDRGLACPRPNQQQYMEASPYETNMNGRTRMMGNGNGMSMAMGAQEAALVGNGREWTSPFEGKDLFSLSRQYVPPSL